MTEARTVIHFLNETVGRSFRETEGNLTSIRCRFQEGGVDIEGVKAMIVRQKALWGADPKMSEYLRIETLFAKSKFDSYYAARELPVQNHAQTRRENPRNFGVTTNIEEQKRLIAAKLAKGTADQLARSASLAAKVAGSGDSSPSHPNGGG